MNNEDRKVLRRILDDFKSRIDSGCYPLKDKKTIVFNGDNVLGSGIHDEFYSFSVAHKIFGYSYDYPTECVNISGTLDSNNEYCIIAKIHKKDGLKELKNLMKNGKNDDLKAVVMSGWEYCELPISDPKLYDKLIDFIENSMEFNKIPAKTHLRLKRSIDHPIRHALPQVVLGVLVMFVISWLMAVTLFSAN